ncbi:MAG: DUF4917 family protein [Actinomycetota bacterium]|nr:DUF4917 family protein [Actinomycetota bacterium]
MGDYGLDDWADLAGRGWPALLVGNGASCAVSAKFAYGSLFDVAPLDKADIELFDALDTVNFEEALNHLRTARLVCNQLGHNDDEVHDRYLSIRESLINAVNAHHVAWEEVDTGGRLKLIRDALLAYDRVFTTSYDLLSGVSHC